MTSLNLGKTRSGETEEQIERRKRVWRHNSFMGHAVMMQKQANAMIEAETTSYMAKKLAMRIQEMSADLAKELKTRIDLPQPSS